MSSPIRPDKDANPALKYAPPWVRDQGQELTEFSPLPEQPSRYGNGAGRDFKDRAAVETRRRATLEPEWLPGPPQSSAGGGSWWRLRWGGWCLASRNSLPGRLSGSLAFAAWRLSSRKRRWAARSQAVQKSQVPWPQRSSSAPNGCAQKPLPRRRCNKHRIGPNRMSPSRTSPPPPRLRGRCRAAGAGGDGAEPSPQPPDLVLRQLPRDELASMLQRANDFIKAGDLSAARLLLQRAAEAGNAHAALTLASTFDPNVLKALGFQDAGADVAMARLWYERAVKFGSAEAPQQLQQLTTLNLPK